MKKYAGVLSENFQFLEMKFSLYLPKRRVLYIVIYVFSFSFITKFQLL